MNSPAFAVHGEPQQRSSSSSLHVTEVNWRNQAIALIDLENGILSVVGIYQHLSLCMAKATLLLIHPMISIELHKLPELISSVRGVVSKEAHESNCNDRNNCEHYCQDHNDYKEAPHANRHIAGDQ
jgi:hypothetical protein